MSVGFAFAIGLLLGYYAQRFIGKRLQRGDLEIKAHGPILAKDIDALKRALDSIRPPL